MCEGLISLAFHGQAVDSNRVGVLVSGKRPQAGSGSGPEIIDRTG